MGQQKQSKGRQAKPRVVKGPQRFDLDRQQFRQTFLNRFYDPCFVGVSSQLDDVLEIAWDAYHDYRKSPRTMKAGKGFADPAFEVSVEWLETRRQIREAERRHKNPKSPSRILVVNGSARNDQTCPGEVSKTFRLAQIALNVVKAQRGFEADFLDLSALTAEYGKVIYPCKACVSTAQPLCNWPCTCYPNHALGQVNDWMHELYPRWTAAHGVIILTPVNWYQAPSVLKLMIDRLVCADGGNPDPTSTGGKDPERAKALELQGWPYPKHLAGRAFAVVVHGDAAGVENLRRILADWMIDLELIQAGPSGAIGKYLGYYESYATSHDDLDKDEAFQVETRNAALSLMETVRQIRSGEYRRPDHGLEEPRKK
ncbi:MAG TPA: NAD(P)H-dependent oxidoreductase [Gemmatimonadales bacterium]